MSVEMFICVFVKDQEGDASSPWIGLNTEAMVIFNTVRTRGSQSVLPTSANGGRIHRPPYAPVSWATLLRPVREIAKKQRISGVL